MNLRIPKLKRPMLLGIGVLSLFVLCIQSVHADEEAHRPLKKSKRLVEKAKAVFYDASIFVDINKPLRAAPLGLLGNNLQWNHKGDGAVDENLIISSNLVSKTKDLKTSILRYPGGSLASLYHWEKGIGEISKRGFGEYFHGAGQEKILFGTDEFLGFCRATGAEPLITVNILTGAPQAAADWVRYVNVTRRAAVKLWEIDNEPYLKEDKQPSTWMSPEVYAQKALATIQAMKAVDANIKIIIPVRSDKIGGIPATPWPGYNEKVLRVLAPHVDYVAVHNSYLPFVYQGSFSDESLYLASVAAIATVKDDLDLTLRMVDQYAGQKKLAVAITEYNALFTLNGKSTDRYIESMAGALYLADLLRLYALNPRVEIANFWSLNGNWHFGAVDQQFNPRPAYHVLKYYAQLFQGEIISTTSQGTTLTSSTLGFVPARTDLSSVVSIASKSQKTIRVLVINRHPSRPARVNFQFPKATVFRDIHKIALTAEDYFDHQIKVASKKLTSENTSGDDFFVIPAHSISFYEYTIKR